MSANDETVRNDENFLAQGRSGSDQWTVDVLFHGRIQSTIEITPQVGMQRNSRYANRWPWRWRPIKRGEHGLKSENALYFT